MKISLRRVTIGCAAMAIALLAYSTERHLNGAPLPERSAAPSQNAPKDPGSAAAKQAPATSGAKPSTTAPATPPMTDDEKANQLSDQVNKLMVQCANLITAQDPASLDTCKRQRDLADQYPAHHLMVDRVLAHDEYGIALAAFDRKHEALDEFNQEIRLLPHASKPGATEWSTAYWHRAMIYTQLGDTHHADRDYQSAEASLRKRQQTEGSAHPSRRLRAVLHQHAALLQKEGKMKESRKLLEEAAR